MINAGTFLPGTSFWVRCPSGCGAIFLAGQRDSTLVPGGRCPKCGTGIVVIVGKLGERNHKVIILAAKPEIEIWRVATDGESGQYLEREPRP